MNSGLCFVVVHCRLFLAASHTAVADVVCAGNVPSLCSLCSVPFLSELVNASGMAVFTVFQRLHEAHILEPPKVPLRMLCTCRGRPTGNMQIPLLSGIIAALSADARVVRDNF